MVTWWTLAVTAVALLGVTVVTRRRPAGPLPDHAGYVIRWRRLHGDYDPSGSVFVAGWLRVASASARPFARLGVSPDAITLWMPWVAFAGLALAAEGGRWPLAAAFLVVASAVGDGLDGAVAVLTDRTSRWGYVLDSVADRVSDLVYVAALWVVGAPGPLVVCTGFGVMFVEYLRARGSNAGAGEIGMITVGERPSRVIAASVTLAAVGILPSRADAFATIGAAVLAVLTAIAFVQLGAAIRRSLAAPDDAVS